jgi:hypothetical protein
VRDFRCHHEGDAFALMVDGRELRTRRSSRVAVDETPIGLYVFRIADGTVRGLGFGGPASQPVLTGRRGMDGLNDQWEAFPWVAGISTLSCGPHPPLRSSRMTVAGRLYCS